MQDPLRRTHIPAMGEHLHAPDEQADPLGEDGHTVVPGLVHRYPDRVLFLATPFCSTYCRYCTRSRMVGQTGNQPGDYNFGLSQWEQAFAYIEAHTEIRDVLISGGDPLVLGDDKIEVLLRRLRGIRHVEFLRIGTKVPVVLPMRITRELTRILRRYHPLWMSIHFTHSRELTREVTETCARLADAGIPLGTQTVLLKGINDDLDTMRLPFPLFAKPVAEGTGKGIGPASRAGNRAELSAVCASLLGRFRQPVLVETYLPGRELTVGILGTGRDARVLGVMIDAAAGDGDYFYDNKEGYEDRVEYRLVEDGEALQAADTALAAWRVLRCRDAGRLDLRSDEKGIPQFLEVNPLAGLHPVRLDLVILARLAGYDYQALIEAIVDAFLARNRLSRPASDRLIG
jgi:hypothetical protein